jgi:hypothetical protein
MEFSLLNTALLGIVLLIACLLVSQCRFNPSSMVYVSKKQDAPKDKSFQLGVACFIKNV